MILAKLYNISESFKYLGYKIGIMITTWKGIFKENMGWYIKATNIKRAKYILNWGEVDQCILFLITTLDTFGESSAFPAPPDLLAQHNILFQWAQWWEEDGKHLARTPTSLTPMSLHLLSIRSPLQGGRWPIKILHFSLSLSQCMTVQSCPQLWAPIRAQLRPSDLQLERGLFWDQEKRAEVHS